MKNKLFLRFSTLMLMAVFAQALFSFAAAADSAESAETMILLSDTGITVNGEAASEDDTSAVYLSHDIIYYEDRDTYDSGNPYGEGTEEERHSAEEAAAHTVIHISQPGTYRIRGTLSLGQIAVDLGSDAKTDPQAVVTLILDNVNLTCTVAPAVIFYNVYECDQDWIAYDEGETETYTASSVQDTTAAGANVILADDSVNTITGSHVARIYKDNESQKKLHKYDGAFYSKQSLNLNGGSVGNGVLNIIADNEGLDSELHLTINGGTIYIRAQNDGINTNEDGVSVTTINGGYLHIVAGLGSEGDGIDSNGYLMINSGWIVATANPSADSGLDSDMGSYVNGGYVVATGSTMDWAESDSEQVTMNLQFASRQDADEAIVVTTLDGAVVFAYDPAPDETTENRGYQGAVISCPEFAVGETYYVYVGGNVSGEEINGLYDVSTVTGFSGAVRQQYTGSDVGMGGGQPGGMGGDPSGGTGEEPPEDVGGEPPEGVGGGPSGDMGGTASILFYMQDKVNAFSGVTDETEAASISVQNWTTDTDTTTIYLSDPGGLLEGPVVVYAASYDASGKMLGIAQGTLDGTTLTFSQALEAGWQLFLLDGDTYIPLTPKLMLQGGRPSENNGSRAYIEDVLNLANNAEQEWTYSENADAWILSVVSAVAYPELPDYQGVSVCVPSAYVVGIDTDGDGTADETSGTIKGRLVIDYDAQIVSSNGQIYTAATAPVILNTGAAGYSAMKNSTASTSHASDGYINVSCGNRGKQSTATDADGNTYYTGDAPSCLADQKAAARFVKYNILLGNLPGNVDYFVSTGGSGGGAHAAMFAATGNHSDFYDYQIEAGAVGVYKNEDGTYSTTVTIDGIDYEISDGAWGCIAYSAITPLYEADMSLAFEYYLNTDYSFGSPFQAQLAEYLSASYMEYINGQNLSVEESAVGFDLDGDGELNSTIALTIAYDPETHPETNGYYGSYLDLYLAEFTQNLQWYLDNLDYTEGWTWFNEDGSAMSDEEVAAMSTEDKAEKFIAGLYNAASGGGMPGGPGGTTGDLPDGERPDDMGGGSPPDGDVSGMGDIVGTPDAGTTQSASGSSDSANYSSYEEMVEAYRADIEDVYAGDEYGNNIVELYNPLNYIRADTTDDPIWTKIIMGASEGDMSMFNSLNLQIAWLNANVDAEIEWQWNGGHVPNEILGDSFSLYVDQMYGEYVEGAVSITKSEAVRQTENGTAEEATGTDLSSWVSYVDGTVSFSLADVAAYRTNGASKAMPGFDVIDYGQEDYVFGDDEQDARHWDKYLLEIFEKYADTLELLFNQQ